PWRAARPYARGNRAMAKPALDGLVDAARYRGGGARSADADQGVRSVGAAQARDRASPRRARREAAPDGDRLETMERDADKRGTFKTRSSFPPPIQALGGRLQRESSVVCPKVAGSPRSRRRR